MKSTRKHTILNFMEIGHFSFWIRISVRESWARFKGLSRLVFGGLVSVALFLTVSGCGVGYLTEVPIRESTWQGMKGRVVDAVTGQALAQVRIVVRPADEPVPKRPYYVFSERDGGFQLNRVTRQGDPEPLAAGTRYILLFSTPTHRVRQVPVVFKGGTHELGILELSSDAMQGRMLPVIPGKLVPEGQRDPDALRRIGPPVY